MFLPVLLVRDYGIWGWIVFAVPNVIGAAAMGWMLRSRSSSRHILSRTRAGMPWFSSIRLPLQVPHRICWMHSRAVVSCRVLGRNLSGRHRGVYAPQSYFAGIWRERADLVSSDSRLWIVVRRC